MKKSIQISEEQLKYIFAEEWPEFQKIFLMDGFCPNCNEGYSREIINYQAILNDLNDIVIRGTCATCGGPVNRYIETGEVEEYRGRIGEVR